MDRFDTEVGAEGRVAARPRFGAAHAMMAFGLVVFGQIAVGIGLFFIAMTVAVARGADANDPRFVNAMTEQMMVPSIVGSAVITIIVVLLALRLWAWHLAIDRSREGLGFFLPPLGELLLWIGAGVLLAAAYLTATHFVTTDFQGGPLAKVATAGGSGRAVWAIVALLFAPFFEEVLFRGLMLRGLMASWGVTAAGTIVTILFFAIHLFETAGYWPALAAIAVMSLVTLFARLRTGSVYASIAVHAAYNLAIVLAVYAFTPNR